MVCFQAMISNLRYQKSVKKVKKCEKVKVKAFCLVGVSNRWRVPSLVDRRSQKSRSSLIDHEPWVPSSFFGNFSSAIFLSENAFLRNIRKQAKKRKEGKKSLEDLAASVSPVTRKAHCQTSKEWSPMIAKIQLFEPETVLDIHRKEI